MRVGVEGSLFFKPRTGVGQYAIKLTEAASQLDSNVDFEIVRHWLPLRKFKPPIKPNKHLRYRLVKWFPPAVYFQVFKRLGTFLPYDLVALRKYDCFLFYNFVAFPVRKKTRSVVVIHDLSYVHYPQFVLKKNLDYLNKFVPRSIKRAARILAVSEHTKADIIKYYDIPADKISVIYNAVDHSEYYPRPAKEVSAVRSKYKLPAKYILFTGTIEPRKNVEGILGAYAALDEQVKKDHGLVLAGGKGWNDEPIRQAIDKLKSAGEKIICTGYVPDEDLPALFSGASLFVYPSFYEGFGIPPLEAMACGVPVITADNSSLPEVVGDAVIMIKAENIAAITQSISKVLNDSQLANSLRQKGLEQAKKFSWEKSAQTLITLLNSLKS